MQDNRSPRKALDTHRRAKSQKCDDSDTEEAVDVKSGSKCRGDSCSEENSDDSSSEDKEGEEEGEGEGKEEEWEEDYYSSDEDENGSDDEEPSEKILEATKEIAEKLVADNLILLPTSTLPGKVDIDLCLKLNESNKRPLLYSVVQEDNGKLQILKLAGATTNGKKRATYLDAKQRYPTDAIYMTLLDLNLINADTNRFVIESIRKMCKDNCTIDEETLKEMSIQDALNSQDENGVPFTFNLTMYYIVHREAFKLNGLLKRLTIHAIESGFQELAKTLEGLSLGEKALESVQHEFLGGKYLMKRAGEKMLFVAKELNRLLETLRETYGDEYVEYLRRESILLVVLAAWAPDVDCLIFTAVIYDGMVGKGRWGDAYEDRHPCKKGEGDVYDASLFREEDDEVAKNNIEEYAESMKLNGKVGALNSNARAFLYMKTTAPEFLESKGWKEIFTVGVDDLFVYAYKEKNWEYPAIILLHDPPCPIMNSDPKEKVDRKWINTSRKTSVAITALDEFAKFLINADARSFSEDLKDYPILGNITVMQCMIEYLVVHLHYYRYGTSVIAKDLRVDFDVLRPEHTGLLIADTPRLTKFEPSSQKDRQIGDKLRCILSKGGADQIDSAAKLIHNNDRKRRSHSKQVKMLQNFSKQIGLDNELFKEIKTTLDQREESHVEKEAENKKQVAQATESNARSAMMARFQRRRKS